MTSSQVQASAADAVGRHQPVLLERYHIGAGNVSVVNSSFMNSSIKSNYSRGYIWMTD